MAEGQPTDLNSRVATDGISVSSGDEHRAKVEEYKTDANALVDGLGKAPGVNSIFNPFNVFRYSKYGLNVNDYNKEQHFDYETSLDSKDVAKVAGAVLGDIGGKINQLSDQFKSFGETKQNIENPTESAIIAWAEQNASDGKGGAITPTPYTSADFIWCKYYGRVPNNRMVTLRRYPIPVEDNLMILDQKSPLVPIAQAVTWYGADIDNPLKEIINLNWGFKWENLEADVTDVSGNEIDIDAVLSVINITKEKDPAQYKLIKNQLFGVDGDTGKFDMMKLTGYDTEMQKYIKGAYGPKGPYWNRILGPVNVVNETKIRKRGFDYQPDINVKFNYSLRSYGGINPKMAFLDLLTNFLSLTYNTAPFWGGDIRYFEKTGVTFDQLGMENDILKGNMLDAVTHGGQAIASQASAGLQGLIDILANIGENVTPGSTSTLDEATLKKFTGAGNADTSASSVVGQTAAMYSTKLKKLMRDPLSYRAILDGRSVGEWHITVGNPMNPMAVMGNLLVDNVTMEVGEVLGVDDFPTEFQFTVKLKHGRPRAKQDIESIFNLGNGRMAFSALADPSSANNSYGERNSSKLANATGKGATSEVQTNLDTQGVNTASAGAIDGFRSRVSNMYGSGFGKSNILESYFRDVKTKD
jgi:hypothetical protein